MYFSHVHRAHLVVGHDDDGLEGPLTAQREHVVVKAGVSADQDDVRRQPRGKRGGVDAQGVSDPLLDSFHLFWLLVRRGATKYFGK